MERKTIICIISIIINIILVSILFTRNHNSIDTSKYINKIDSLELEISNLEVKKDSIDKEIDTVFVELKVIEKEYEEKYIDILNNNTSDDYIFFSDYIKRNRERLDSINNF